MRLSHASSSTSHCFPAPNSGAVLIIVLWVVFGLITLTLYFAQSMSFELRAADNRVAAIKAEQAIHGGLRYSLHLLANLEEPGTRPDRTLYYAEAVPVADATFWFIGRDAAAQANQDLPWFELVDESAKLNLNTASATMLEQLPRMTAELAAAIIDWRDTNSEPENGGAEDETYLRHNPPYQTKNGPFESVEELRWIAGMTLEILYGEDINRNGVLDPNENDGSLNPPLDNQDGRLDPGLIEFLTVHTRQPETSPDGSPLFSLSGQNRNELRTLLQEAFGEERAGEVLPRLPNNITSLIQFYLASRLSPEEFHQIEPRLTSGVDAPMTPVNINTAGEPVLLCLPDMTQQEAQQILAYRQSNPDRPDSVSWLSDAVDREVALRIGPFVTGRTYHFTADIAALGQHHRGYQRVRFVIDASGEKPEVRYRQDLTHLGWALTQHVTLPEPHQRLP